MDGQTAEWVDERHQSWLERRFGVRARNWIAGLGDLVSEVGRRWDLEVTFPGNPGRTSVVLVCHHSDGTPVILKISPDPGLMMAEARTLGLWHNTGRVPVVRGIDEHVGALLLEAIEPGHTVRSTGQPPDFERVASLLVELHSVELDEAQWRELRPLQGLISHYFDQWEWRYAEGVAAETMSVAQLHRGHARARDLAANTDGAVVLHGDLHTGNVLDGGPQRGLVAVGPQGCAGEPAFDAAPWVLWRAESLAQVGERITMLAHAVGRSEERLREACGALAPVAVAACLSREGDVVSRAEIETLLALAEE